jgi:hypothetical protein
VTNPKATDTLISWEIGKAVSLAPEFSEPNSIAELATADATAMAVIKADGAARSVVMDDAVEVLVAKDPLEQGVERATFATQLTVRLAGQAKGGATVAQIVVGTDGVAKASFPNPQSLHMVDFDQLKLGLKPTVDLAGWIGFFRWAKSKKIDLAALTKDLAEAVKSRNGLRQ